MAVKLLSAVTAIGASPSHNLRGGIQEHTVQVNITGAPTAVAVSLEASLDNGTNWPVIGTYAFVAADLTAGFAMFHVINKPTELVRLNLTVLTGGTAPTVTGYYLAFRSARNS